LNPPAVRKAPEPPPIDSDAGLAGACARWSAAGIIGVDTEFVRERTYFPRPALVQVADADGVVLVDPLDISDTAPFADLVTDPAVVKVMHAASEDLEVLEVLTGASPENIFDTQLAGAFVGNGFSLGYRALVEALLGVVLDKGETRSDWLKRPLSPRQLQYAVLDAAYLLPMHARLSKQLAALGRAAWLEEEQEHQRRARALDKQPEAAYLRVRGRDRLSPGDHAVLRALSQWREREAMVRDVPRRHLISDEVLVTLAALSAPDAKALENIRELSRRTAADYGETLLGHIQSARNAGPTEIDSPVDLRPYAGTIKRLKRIVRQEADILKLPPELLANRRALETFLIRVLKNGGKIPQEFQGWRFDVITWKLRDVLHDSN
jgi:ribonuclease D